MFRFENILLSFFGLVFLLFTACEDAVPVPKPHAYPRVIFPEKNYGAFDQTFCAFTFESPKYARVEKDTSFFESKPKDECWFNLSVDALSAKIHCSYSPIASKKEFADLLQDAFTLAQKHNIKASYIEEIPVRRPADKVYGMVFDIQGPAASPYQFFLTDSTRHFLRGALYFNAQARPDSLAPVIDFLKKDVDRLVQTLKWN